MSLVLLKTILIFSLCLELECSEHRECPNLKTNLSLMRKRRHLVFPDSTNFVATLSLVKAIMTHAPSGWNIALELDVVYPVPNSNFTLAHKRKKLHRQQKRDLLRRIADAIDVHNLDGKACVLRAICEAESSLAPPGRSLVHDILRALFLLPASQDHVKEVIGESYELFTKPGFCSSSHDYCQFSLIDFIFSFNKNKDL